ncbi:hypothetical protein LB941_06400 [Ligilactobacillus sp. WILCCON 0076]|uniref:Uncharacterized protein n=1 Tax=Ligilactobacillus ubinensis TaxID=2876789 RepID=A0A9X2JLG8_9LACO|nr:hypothetical protein [Ligilactobacillus ubinensis]MCP0886963.1 hypothetical protein [Ligilactobacillus ubinensis]
MTNYRKLFLTWIQSMQQITELDTPEIAENSELKLVVVTSAGIFEGKIHLPEENKFQEDLIGSSWLEYVKQDNVHEALLSNHDDLQLNSIWLSDVTELNTKTTFQRLVIFVEEVVAVTLSGNLNLNTDDQK